FEDDGGGAADQSADGELESGAGGEDAVGWSLNGAGVIEDRANLRIDQRRGEADGAAAAGGEVDAEGEADVAAGGELDVGAAFQAGDLAQIDVEADVGFLEGVEDIRIELDVEADGEEELVGGCAVFFV